MQRYLLSILYLIYCRILCIFFFLMIRQPPRSTLFPYTRSSDLHQVESCGDAESCRASAARRVLRATCRGTACRSGHSSDRKSTRLNSSHVKISYAVFCLKKKKIELVG